MTPSDSTLQFYLEFYEFLGLLGHAEGSISFEEDVDLMKSEEELFIDYTLWEVSVGTVSCY